MAPDALTRCHSRQPAVTVAALWGGPLPSRLRHAPPAGTRQLDRRRSGAWQHPNSVRQGDARAPGVCHATWSLRVQTPGRCCTCTVCAGARKTLTYHLPCRGLSHVRTADCSCEVDTVKCGRVRRSQCRAEPQGAPISKPSASDSQRLLREAANLISTAHLLLPIDPGSYNAALVIWCALRGAPPPHAHDAQHMPMMVCDGGRLHRQSLAVRHGQYICPLTAPASVIPSQPVFLSCGRNMSGAFRSGRQHGINLH